AVDVSVTGAAVLDRAVAPADPARLTIAVAGDAVERGSMSGGERVGQRLVVVAGPADAPAGRWGGLAGWRAPPPPPPHPHPTHPREHDDHADPFSPAFPFLDQHAIPTIQSNAFA